MPRLLLLFAVPALLLAACGGGGDGDDPATPGAEGTAGPTATPTPQLLPTPPKATDDEQILNVSSGDNVFVPTLKEFRDLPKTKIDAKGQREGVSLAELANRVSAPAEATVTLQGYRNDGRKIQFVRQPLKDIGSESVLSLDEAGRVRLFSSKLGEEEWLVNVVVVSFQ
jgi:hypothetical protein